MLNKKLIEQFLKPNWRRVIILLLIAMPGLLSFLEEALSTFALETFTDLSIYIISMSIWYVIICAIDRIFFNKFLKPSRERIIITLAIFLALILPAAFFSNGLNDIFLLAFAVIYMVGVWPFLLLLILVYAIVCMVAPLGDKNR